EARRIVRQRGARELIGREPHSHLLPAFDTTANVGLRQSPQMPCAAILGVRGPRALGELTDDVRAATREPIGIREDDERSRVVGTLGDDVLVHGNDYLVSIAMRLGGGEEVI